MSLALNEGSFPPVNSKAAIALKANAALVVKATPLSRATLEPSFRTTPAILHSFDCEGRLIAASDTRFAKFGYSREEVLADRT